MPWRTSQRVFERRKFVGVTSFERSIRLAGSLKLLR